MNEPAKRGPGRPSNAEIAARNVAVQAAPEPTPAERAQAYAMRVWNGQSEFLGRAERIARVKRAVEGQGLDFADVTLPNYESNRDDGEAWSPADSAPVTLRYARR